MSVEVVWASSKGCQQDASMVCPAQRRLPDRRIRIRIFSFRRGLDGKIKSLDLPGDASVLIFIFSLMLLSNSSLLCLTKVDFH